MTTVADDVESGEGDRFAVPRSEVPAPDVAAAGRVALAAGLDHDLVVAARSRCATSQVRNRTVLS